LTTHMAQCIVGAFGDGLPAWSPHFFHQTESNQMIKQRALQLVIGFLVLSVFGGALLAQRETQVPGNGGNGIYVGTPKVYDERTLELLLISARSRLSQLTGFDAASLNARLGTIQGASVTQSQLGVQVTGLPQAGVNTTTNTSQATANTTVDLATSQKAGATAPDTTTDNKTISTAPTGTGQTVVTAPQVQALNPGVPTAPGFAMPSTFAVSSVDVLNEQMQLNAEIINLQLLLGGALNDDLVEGTGLRKRRATLGFPIAIATPSGYQYRDAVAEVEVSVCNPPGAQRPEISPSVVTLLPREKTYNVASVLSKATSFGGGVIAGVLNFGGGFLRGRQTYYLVHDQDTVALQRMPNGTCKYSNAEGSPATFVWQFRPVLGQRVVRDGLRQTFVQVAVPPGMQLSCAASLTIQTAWRRYDAKTGRVGEVINVPEFHTERPANFNLAPVPSDISVADNGDGNLVVIAKGSFGTGVRVRIGNAFLDESSPGFERNTTYIKFVANAAAVALQGARFVNRDGTERDIVEGTMEDLAPCTEAKPVVSVKTDGQRRLQPYTITVQPAAPKAPENVDPKPAPEKKEPAPPSDQSTAISRPINGTTSELTITLKPADPKLAEQPDVPVVLIGSRVFGLRDFPFIRRTETEIVLQVSTDLLRANPQVKRLHLFATYPVRTISVTDVSRFTVASLTLVSSGDTSHFAVTGTSLQGLTIDAGFLAPVPVTLHGDLLATFSLTREQLSGRKNVIMLHPPDAPILMALPAAAAAPEPKPSLEKHAAINVGEKSLTVTGNVLDAVVGVHYLEEPIPFLLATDKKSITMQLPDGMTTTPGIQVLEVLYIDKTSVRYEVPIKAK
jgi:hypothetical protein